MKEHTISGGISYIESSDDPLSSDIGIIRDGTVTWLFDVGDGAQNIGGLNGTYNAVLSHFHRDHTGNLGHIRITDLYVSAETFRHTHEGIIVSGDIRIGEIHIFPFPSSHAKGCLALEAGDTYVFTGDGTYCCMKDGCAVYNATLLKDEINVLKKLRAPFLLESHNMGTVRERAAVIAELERIYAGRVGNEPYIRV
ncbi:MAG: hypothetical protein MJ142_01140 [Clostridia bacterium]|nr:hypothetical protein [Clostridia bacterium]